MIPPKERDKILWEAIESGHLDESLAIDAELTSDLAAYRRLESLFAALRAAPAASRDPPLPSRLGRYEIREIIGRGAFGTVCLATDPQLDRPVAIKVPHAQAFRSEQDARQFLDEAKLAARLKHPGIVTIHDAGQDQGFFYIVMEYVKGHTLLEAGRRQPQAFDWIISVLAEVADALSYAHANGFFHRDLKPANILIDADGHPHITDFGLAISEQSQHLRAGQVAGTPAYMSPEQVRGETHWLDGRTDIWSLGIILYELLTGRRPFAERDVPSCLDEIRNRIPKPPRQISNAIPERLQEICLRCLEKDPARRFATAADVASALRTTRSNAELPYTARPRSATFRRYGAWISVALVATAPLATIALVLNPPAADGPEIKPPSGQQRNPLDPQFFREHPEAANLLGILYDGTVDGSSPAAWMQVEKQETPGTARDWGPLKNGSHLSSRDRYRIRFRAPEETYFYVFQIDTRGQVYWVFPKNSACAFSTGANPVPANTTVNAPDGDSSSFFLDECPGVEHVYVVATTQAWPVLETKLAAIGRGQQSNGRQPTQVDRPIGRGLRGIGGIASDNPDQHIPVTGVRGVLAKEFWFHHVEPTTKSEL